MTVVQAGSINTAALVVPDLLVQVLPPSVQLINGTPTNLVGVVGTATWGPVGVPTLVGDFGQYVGAFGQLQNRANDMGTAVAIMVQQGANNMRCVRVTDGTDTAAAAVVLSNCITFTARYTGSLGNSVSVAVSAGSAASSYRATVTLPGIGQAPEIFDNITGSGNAFWVNLAAAINNGQSGLRGPSNLITAAAGVGTTAPAVATYALSGGTDGAGVSASNMIGVDTVPRKGMYALRGTGVGIAFLADVTDTTTWATQVAFGLAEGIYMLGSGAAGESITTAASNKATAGTDTTTFKVLLGDWVYWLDTVTGVTRLVSPVPFVAGLLGNLAPHQSSLNKPVYGVTGTQRSRTGSPYSSADLTALGQAGIDVICNPVPGGSYFGVRFGRNASSNAVIRGDNYTRMTNFIAATLNRGMGYGVGKPITPDLFRQIGVTLSGFFGALHAQGMIADYSVKCDATNNPPNRTALGYLQADVKVQYLAITEYLLANVEGGQSVQITRLPTATTV
jgi:phage tail sheath protein FI